jgi:hypothetical protein
MLAQVGWRAKADVAGDALDRLVGGFQKLLGQAHPFRDEPSQRTGPSGGGEPPHEGALPKLCAAGEIGHGQRVIEVLARPIEDRAENVAVGGAGGRLHILRLAALAMWRHDHASSNGVGDRSAMVKLDEVQAEIDAGTGPCGGEDVAVVDIEDVGVEFHRGPAARELRGVQLVGGGRPSIEQAGSGEQIDPGADRCDTRTALVGLSQRLQQRLRRCELHGSRTSGHEHGVRAS